MKWISDLFGRKKGEPPSPVSLADAEKLAAEKTKPEQEGLSIALSRIYQDIEEKRKGLAEANLALEKARVGEAIHERLLRAAVTNKDNIAKQISAITGTIKLPDQKDYPTALEFYNASSRTIAECTQRSTISYQYVKLVFEQESRDVREKARLLEEAFATLKKELDSRKENFEASSKVLEAIRRIKEQTESGKSLKRKSSEAEELKERLKKELESERAGLEQLNKSEQASHLEGLKKELEAAETSLKNNREQAIALVSPVERLLKKFRKEAEDGRTRNSNLKLMDLYIANPGETLLSDRRMELCDMATEMRTLTGTGQLEKDPKKAEKLLQNLGELKPETIRPILLRHENLSLKKEALQKQISASNVESEKSASEARIKRIEEQIGEAEKESERAKTSLLQLEEELSKSKKVLETGLSELGENITLE